MTDELKVLDGGWVLRAGAFVFFGAAILALGVPRARRIGPDETVAERAALHLPSIVRAGKNGSPMAAALKRTARA